MSDCINEIWEQFNKPLKNFIKKRIQNEQDTDDILQEVFIKINSNIENLNDNSKIHSWIYKITQNTIIDYYRKRGENNRFVELSDNLESKIDEDLTLNGEIAECLKSMINSLPEEYKQAILLTEFQNLTQKELSLRMGLSVSGAKSRVQRARKKLKEILLGCCRLEFDRLGNVINYEHKSSNCKYCKNNRM